MKKHAIPESVTDQIQQAAEGAWEDDLAHDGHGTMMRVVALCILISLTFSGVAMAQAGNDLSGMYSEALERLAKDGDPRAQTALADEYYLGLERPQDFGEAAKWYHRAAEQGFAKAQNLLGEMYKLGQGVRQDFQEAAKWYRMAAEQGEPMAQLALGIMYAQGRGLPRNFVQAYMWIALAELSLPSATWQAVQRNWDPLSELEKEMSAAEVAQGRKLAREWKPKIK